jgi:hypothetical protein
MLPFVCNAVCVVVVRIAVAAVLLLLLLQALTEFYGSLSADWALECLKELLLTNMQVCDTWFALNR